MRLSDETRQIIRDTTAEIFGEGAQVRLFGSRVDDTARGGDIDCSSSWMSQRRG